MSEVGCTFHPTKTSIFHLLNDGDDCDFLFVFQRNERSFLNSFFEFLGVCVCVRVGVIRLPRNLGIPLEIVLFYWGAYVCAHAHEGVRWGIVITYACTHRDWAITSQQLG